MLKPVGWDYQPILVMATSKNTLSPDAYQPPYGTFAGYPNDNIATIDFAGRIRKMPKYNFFDDIYIKNNKSKLYCCNREYKKLPGGEEIYFDKYPFSNSKRIFYENCPWCQKFYSIKKLPFIFNYDGNHKHCLIEFN